MKKNIPQVLTGQQIGIGWSPALSVIKALTALHEAKQIGGQAIFWMADEDHDALEVSRTVLRKEGRILKAQFEFNLKAQTSTGWFPFNELHQKQAVELWGSQVPIPREPTLRGHFEALGEPLKALGLSFFSPTRDIDRFKLNTLLLEWRELQLEKKLSSNYENLLRQGIQSSVDPSKQSTWFSLNPKTGERLRLDPSAPLGADLWLSPGAALRPLFQSYIHDVHTVILGPSEFSYWQLIEPLWEVLGIKKPKIKIRPSLWTIPAHCSLEIEHIPLLRQGNWQALLPKEISLPSRSLSFTPSSNWDPDTRLRINQELERTKERLEKIDRKIQRTVVHQILGEDPEILHQYLFPLEKDQERVLSGAPWLLDTHALGRVAESLSHGSPLVIMKEV
ncbi:MAG: bacillithiol biosynthesis BshC [Holophagaceae bacterium]